MLDADDVLGLWAAGRSGTAADGALCALERVHGDMSSLTAGVRDRDLLTLHAALFGPVLDAVAQCPACDDVLECAVPIDGLLSGVAEPDDCREVRSDDIVVRFRQPTVGDLRAPIADAAVLLDRCVTHAAMGGAPRSASELPVSVRDAVEDAMQRADPWSELTIALTCPACGHEWEDVVDPSQFVWNELSRVAAKLTDDVVDLARAFGWSEAEILALEPARRRLYLDAVRRQ